MLIDAVRTATCTSAEPVSLDPRPYLVAISALRSLVSGTKRTPYSGWSRSGTGAAGVRPGDRATIADARGVKQPFWRNRRDVETPFLVPVIYGSVRTARQGIRMARFVHRE